MLTIYFLNLFLIVEGIFQFKLIEIIFSKLENNDLVELQLQVKCGGKPFEQRVSHVADRIYVVYQISMFGRPPKWTPRSAQKTCVFYPSFLDMVGSFGTTRTQRKFTHVVMLNENMLVQCMCRCTA